MMSPELVEMCEISLKIELTFGTIDIFTNIITVINLIKNDFNKTKIVFQWSMINRKTLSFRGLDQMNKSK